MTWLMSKKISDVNSIVEVLEERLHRPLNLLSFPGQGSMKDVADNEKIDIGGKIQP